MSFDWSRYVGFDVETSSEVNKEYALQPFRAQTGDAFISSYAVTVKKDGQLLSRAAHKPTKEELATLLEKCIAGNKTLVGWNVAFDAAWLVAIGLEDLVLRVKWLDAMMLWKHLTVTPEYGLAKGKKKSYSLKAAVPEFMPEEAGYEDGVDFFDMSPEMVAKRLVYNKKDTEHTMTLCAAFYEALEKNPQQLRCALIEGACIPMVASAHVRGLVIDIEQAHKLDSLLTAEQEEMLAELEKYGATPKILSSPAQLAKLLFEDWGLPVLKTTPAGKPSTDKEVLHELFNTVNDPRAGAVRRYREATGNQNKFATGTLASVAYNGDGRVRPAAMVYSTYTGRMTFSSKQGKGKDERPTGIPIHQMKGDKGGKLDKEYRRMVLPPPGYTVMEFDAAGQEFRWMAIMSEDPTMLQLCAEGEDAHSYMGSQIDRMDYRELIELNHAGDKKAKNARKLGKFCIAEGQPVLTGRGLVPIEQVRVDDVVWDGVEWVHHTGVVFTGVRDVIKYQGLAATPDHEVWLADGTTTTLQQAASEGLQIAASGDAGSPVWVLGAFEFHRHSEREKHVLRSNMRLRCGCDACTEQLTEWEVNTVSGVRGKEAACCARSPDCDKCGCRANPKKVRGNVSEVRESKRQGLQELRRARDTVQVCISESGYGVRAGELAAPRLYRSRVRPGRQQRTLRSRELEAVKQAREYAEHSEKFVLNTRRQHNSSIPRVPRSEIPVARGNVRPEGGGESSVERTYCGADSRQVHKPLQLQAKRTYDITNAGPRHRFTVSNCLVSNCNLSFQYRISAAKATVKARVEYGLDVQEPYIQGLKSVYLKAYPGIEQYWKKQIAMCRRLGYAETLAGRRVDMRGDWRKDKWSLESTSINFPIQGVGADQKYLALAMLKPYLNKIGGYLFFELHDGIYVLVPNDKVRQAAYDVRQLLNTLPYEKAWSFKPPVPLPWDCKFGPSWGDLREFDFSKEEA